MVSTPDFSRLTATIRTLREVGVVPQVARRLKDDADAILKSLLDAVLGDVPAFTVSGNPTVIAELGQHLKAHIDEVGRLLASQPPGDLAFVRDHARRRAEQKFPLDAVLASYRCVHRTLSQSIRDAALASADESAQLRRVVAAVADFSLEYIGAISSLITSEYVSQTRTLSEAEGDLRAELFKLLLSGYDEADSRAGLFLRRAGYLEQRQSYCVVVARSVDARQMDNPARAERMADAVHAAVRNLPVRVLIGVRDNLVTVVLSGTRRLSGWTAPQSLLADRIYPHLRTIGPAALIGVSTDAPSTSHIPNALREAQIALDFASVGERVMPYARIPFRDMLIRVAAGQLQSALPAWFDAFCEADSKSRGSLTATLRAYADANMNALKTAERLSLHPNTVYARMHKIHTVTKRNPLHYDALTELLLAGDCAALAKKSPAHNERGFSQSEDRLSLQRSD